MSAPTPTWYDVLGVDPDAGTDEVRAAWRAGIADLDPTERRFALLNEAAQVLLDDDRRAAYDAELAAAVPEPEPEPEPIDEPRRESIATTAGERRPVPGWLIAGLAVAVLLVAGVAGAVAATIPSDRSIEEASTDARAAAEEAVVPILSYDGKHLEDSRAAAEPLLTGDYRKEFDTFYDEVMAGNAPRTGTVVRAELIRSGLVRADEDRVQVFVLVDMTRTNDAEKQPVVFKNWVTMTMERVDGAWLVAGMDT